MTSQKELRNLISAARNLTNVWIHVEAESLNGEIKAVRVETTRPLGIGPCPMAPIVAAEKLRELLHRAAQTV